jgi:O-antigen ligase
MVSLAILSRAKVKQRQSIVILTKLDRSAIYLAMVLLFGLLCVQALLYFIGIAWERRFTVFLYCVASAWLAVLIARQARQWWVPNRLDLVVLFFWFYAAVSILYRLKLADDTVMYLLYAPFMAVLPYFCGRLIRICFLQKLMYAIVALGLTLTILLIIDRFYLASNSTILVRRPIFGYDHGRLLIGALLAVALPSTCFFGLTAARHCEHTRSISYLVPSACATVLTVTLVSTLARGWLVAGLFGTLVVVVLTKPAPAFRRFFWISLVAGAVIISHVIFLKFDPHYNHFAYAKYAETDFRYELPQTSREINTGGPILPGDSCRALRGGDSISVRQLLYVEAVAMFKENPLFGVGAAKFGHFSCWASAGSYPHSTLLHVLAELGLLGGCLFLAALALASGALLRYPSQTKDVAHAQASVAAFALICLFFLADQFYGNYFMTTGSWLMLGLAASALNEIRDSGSLTARSSD